MKSKFIAAHTSFKEWKKDPQYVAEYDALQEEFALASVLIEARGKADMTQEEVAEAMGTTQAVVAMLESGKVLPSTRTLERFAKAPHTGYASVLNRNPSPLIDVTLSFCYPLPAFCPFLSTAPPAFWVVRAA